MTPGEPCQCPLDLEERARMAATGGACKAMTRLSVMIAELGVGTWRVNTGGQWAARELSATVSLVAALSAQGVYVPGTLSIDARESAGRHGDKPRQDVVPVLDFPNLTIPDVQSGRSPVGAIVAGSQSLPLPEPQTLDGASAPAAADAGVVTNACRPTDGPAVAIGSAGELVERLNALPKRAKLACHRRLRDGYGFPRRSGLAPHWQRNWIPGVQRLTVQVEPQLAAFLVSGGVRRRHRRTGISWHRAKQLDALATVPTAVARLWDGGRARRRMLGRCRPRRV